MKRKILTTVIAVAMAIGLVACGSITKEDTKATTESTEEVETTETIESSTEAEEEKLTTEESTESTTETDVNASTETSEAENAPAFTYTDKSGTLYVTQTVNVRDLPDTSGNKVGSLKTNDEVTVTGQCNETGWYRISYDGAVAYVSNAYVSSEKVAVQNNANSGTGNSAAGNNGGSTSASAGAPSGTTLEENIAYAQSLGYDPYVVTWISDTDSVTYYVVNGHGGGRTMEPDLDRPGYAELVSSVCVYDDANMSVMKDTWHLTGEIPVYPGN